MIYDKDKIKGLRLARGYSQTELARRAGLSQPTISAVESGEEHVKATTLERLARALGVPLQELMKSKITNKERESQLTELVAMFDAMDDQHRSALLAAAKAFLGGKKK